MADAPIANMYELPAKHTQRGTRFEAHATRMGPAIGAEKLGAQYMVVPAGKCAFPRHNHHNNEEMFVVLEGEGTYRRGDESWAVKAGDVISAPAGDVTTAHQLTNTSTSDLKYLSISTRNDLDICDYPDSGKYMVASGIPSNGGMFGADYVLLGREKPALDYWDGEDIGEEQ